MGLIKESSPVMADSYRPDVSLLGDQYKPELRMSVTRGFGTSPPEISESYGLAQVRTGLINVRCPYYTLVLYIPRSVDCEVVVTVLATSMT